MFRMHTLKNCVHLNQSVISVHAFRYANVIVCYVWLIIFHLKCDVIVFRCGSCIQLAKLVLFSSILDEMWYGLQLCLIRIISSVNMCIQLYLCVHLLQNKWALQLKCKCKYDPQMHAHPLKCVHCNQNANANMFP